MLMQSQLQLCELEDFSMLIVHDEGDIQTRRRWITMYANREAMEFDGSVWGLWCPNAKETLRLFDFFPITSSQ
jgi:hypothetical protein